MRVLACLLCYFFASIGVAAAIISQEPDDLRENAKNISINDEPLALEFLSASDSDWFKFYAFAGEKYDIVAENMGRGDIVLELYTRDGQAPFETQDEFGDPLASEILYFYQVPADGVYYLLVRLFDDTTFHEGDAAYGLKIHLPVGPATGVIEGVVTNAASHSPVSNAVVKTEEKRADISDIEDGSFDLLDHPTGTFSLTIESQERFLPFRLTDRLESSGEIKKLNIRLIPRDLSGAIAILRMFVAYEPSPYLDSGSDIDGNGRIGMEEALFIMAGLAEM